VQSPPMQLVRKIFDAFERRDVDALLLISHPDVEFSPVTATIASGGRPYVGQEGVRRYFADVAEVWEELRPIPQEHHELPGGVLSLGRVYARGRDGVLVDSPAGWLWRIQGGKVVSGRVFSSREEALAAAGIADPSAAG
jgi:ketosteroid isomerase-like protein